MSFSLSRTLGRSTGAANLPWPERGLAVRVAARHAAPGEPACLWLQYEGRRVVASGAGALSALPAASATVLILASADVVLGVAVVPPLTGERLREALPNLVEDRALSDPAELHVAIGAAPSHAPGRERALAWVERAWLRGVLQRLAGAGQRVVAVLPESLCVPRAEGAWTIAQDVSGLCARVAPQGGAALPDDAQAAADVVRLWIEQSTDQPARIDILATPAVAAGLSATLKQTLGSILAPPDIRSDALDSTPGALLRRWIEAGGPAAAGGAPLSLLQHEFAGSGRAGAGIAPQWRRVIALLLVLALVQVVGMQVRWGQLRAERDSLRADAIAALRAAVPETTVVLDPALQMTRALAALRAGAGRADPGDFMALTMAFGKTFADLPPRAARSFDFAERSLRARMAPGVAADEQARKAFAQRALGLGYELRFESAPSAGAPAGAAAQPDTIAILRPRGAT